MRKVNLASSMGPAGELESVSAVPEFAVLAVAAGIVVSSAAATARRSWRGSSNCFVSDHGLSKTGVEHHGRRHLFGGGVCSIQPPTDRSPSKNTVPGTRSQRQEPFSPGNGQARGTTAGMSVPVLAAARDGEPLYATAGTPCCSVRNRGR